MKSLPLVSVVMPVYNGERFVVDAVRSILSQSLRDLECIVVDDGSTDRTAELLALEAASDPRLVVHRQPSNMGFMAALNSGCTLARGEFIARMDADDVSLPTRLERQAAFLNANAMVGAVGSAIQLLDEHGVPGRIKSYPVASGLAAWSMVFFNSLAHPAAMMRRTVFDAVGRYPRGCSGGTEDYALFLKISRESRLANLPEVLLRYRVWGGNMTRLKWEAQEDDAVRLLREFLLETFGFELSAPDAVALRGLSRDQFPQDPRAAGRIGSIIEELVPHYVALFSDSEPDARAIRRDAGIRLWLLSALALKRASPQSAFLAVKALTTSPTSFAAFLAKATRRLALRGGG